MLEENKNNKTERTISRKNLLAFPLAFSSCERNECGMQTHTHTRRTESPCNITKLIGKN